MRDTNQPNHPNHQRENQLKEAIWSFGSALVVDKDEKSAFYQGVNDGRGGGYTQYEEKLRRAYFSGFYFGIGIRDFLNEVDKEADLNELRKRRIMRQQENNDKNNDKNNEEGKV